ncbi:KdsC family phosphatase [Desulfatibacillum aliphaticivorans]|uniref:KdsC family phosphatase n=1 Tax=Desulfatibacillum aliphaticivorans TaxID=218208 RepID=UPI0004249F67|nr:HAD hydrolase family protein [Desulfatibacillum aliphaticivorans]
MPDRAAENWDVLEQVDVLLLDVDGVLTDGSITYGDDGGEIKTFSVKDGLGIRMLQLAGIVTGIVTGRSSKALAKRCENLGITHLWDGVKNKSLLIEQISRDMKVPPERMAFVGDDIPDMGIMSKVGVGVAVADAHPDVINAARLVTTKPGGRGAVREVCEGILKAKGLWDETQKQVAV